MHRTPVRLFAVTALVVAATLGVAGCTAGASDTPAPGESSASSALPPVIVELAAIDGTTVEVPLGTLVDLVTATDDDVTAWTAEIKDDTVAEFVPGKDDGSAVFNPGLKPRAEGTTEVVLSNSLTSEKLAFTLTVTP